MRKEDVSGIIVYVLILAVAVVFGLTVLREHATAVTEDMGGTFVYIIYIFGAILAGVLFNSILFEMAHITGAKIGRYEIVSVNILGLLWYKEESKTKFKFSGYDGLTGETRILPKKDAKKEPNPSPYLLFGTLFYMIELTAAIVVFTLFSQSEALALKNIAYFLLIMAVLGGMILLYNILPIKLDATTDGYRMRMTTNAANKIAFNELLRVEYAISQGEENVEIATFTEISNFTAELNLNKVYVLLDKKEFEEAEKLIDIIIEGKEKVSEKVFIRARCQKIYINIITKPLEEARKFYDEQVPMAERRDISNDRSMVGIRTYLLMSGLLDGSKSECLYAINNAGKCFNNTPKQRRKVEADLFNDAIDKIDQLHPTWKLSEYHIEYVEQPVKEKKKKK
ncbi:MAG: hypothetical protein J5511_01695 [Bacilli bacterium]|nr:hypothetical protein [Bacilli bacterium]